MTSITTKTAILSYLEKDIMILRLIEDSEIDLKEAVETFEATLKLAEGRKYAMMIDATVSVQVSSAAREYSAKKERQKNLIAQAIVVTSLANKIIGNFIIKVNKPYAPTRLFSNEEDALAWLREMINKYRG